MASRRILLKVAEPKGPAALTGGRLGAAGPELVLEHLFDVAPDADSTFSLAADSGRAHRWYAAEIDRDQGFAADSGSDWELAHRVLTQQLLGAGEARLLAVEPDLEQTWVTEPPPGLRGPALIGAAPCQPAPQKGGPLPKGPGFAWHLEKRFTTLREARDAVMAAGSDVTIVHLDTGYDANHHTLPQKLDKARQRNFVSGEPIDDARDRTPSIGILINRGHGTGTIGILAGGRLVSVKPPEASTGDFLGGAPLATVVPVRVGNSVVQLRTSSVARGIDYARQIGADVLSMSMGGLPSGAWADAVNAAYEAGVVLVTAAGNNFDGWPTSSIVWPAQFGRVIAACGIMADGRPYFNLPPTVMQGNYGPLSKMATAMAAFTPNIPWPKIGCPDVLDLDGAGTSSATPQIAAAAALWLRKHKAAMTYPANEAWKRAEAVRHALFSTGDKGGSEPHEFFGQGILRAKAALDIAPATTLRKMPLDAAPFSFLDLFAGFGVAADRRRVQLLHLELTQLAVQSKGAREAIPDPGLPAEQITERQRRQFLAAILDEGKASRPLRAYLESQLGRAPAESGLLAPAPRGRVSTGAQLPRQVRRRPPARRMLQLFAVDPGMSNRLDTAFINKTVVDVRWETSPTSDNVLQPGPVGEYLEVVDVDPSSGCAYEPVDLNEPFLLAQDGLAPSEGNPQFHQQMVYAVAMRTVEAFETALGRPVLWAAKRVVTHQRDPRTGKVQPQYAVHYVQRLRIYPHALREANAYYSPDKVALLFGYFPELRPDGDALGGMVFTCLSHDIIAHETTHALLDGLHRRYQEASNVDVLAFHEAFADIVAIFQHFTMPELLRFAIARSQGDLRKSDLMGDLARQFGEALGRSKALRSAIGVDPALINYANTKEPHDRGSVLVAAVFDAFLKIYGRRIDDLLRIATGGTGVLQPGALHPDLVERLAQEAAKTARHVMQICIRALDYCPPLDITFTDYLRALITADADLVANDKHGYRVAFLEAFRARGIYPDDVRTLSAESLQWGSPIAQPAGLGKFLATLRFSRNRSQDRREAYRTSLANAAALHEWLEANLTEDMAVHFGLDRFTSVPRGQEDGFRRDEQGRPVFEVHTVRPAHRAMDGDIKTDVVVVITQRRKLLLDPKRPELGSFTFRGGCTLVIDPEKDENPIRYSIIKSVASTRRMERQRAHLGAHSGLGLHALYFGDETGNEPFALLHAGH